MKNITKYLTVTGYFQIKNKKWKIFEYTITGMVLIWIALICYPNMLFSYSIAYRNINVHSTKEIDSNICGILDKAKINLSTSSINDTTIQYDVYLCNNYSLYFLFAPKSRKAFANTYSIAHNIFIANCDVRKNEAYKNNTDDSYTRKLDELIAHEATHRLIDKKLGLLKFAMLEDWKNEGYSEFVGFNRAANFVLAKEFLKANKGNDKPSIWYQKYYYAVAYLMQVKGMEFENMVSTKYTLDEVLNNIETLKTKS